MITAPKLLLKRLLSFTASAWLPMALANVAFAASWADIQFGGFASQGFIYSSANDYHGDSSDGTFDFREYAANASYARGSFRLGAQVFGQKLGEYGDDEITLDWASVDYQPSQWFGLRAGRVKMPRGLYNEALDVDSVRPYIFLPQSAYDARLRDFNAALDGAMLFGNAGLGDFGSIDYRLYYGDIPMTTDSGANDFFNNDVPFPNTAIGMDSALGGAVFWNPPVYGLRMGYSYSVFDNFAMDRDVTFGPGAPPVTLTRGADHYFRHMFSVEYITGDWVLAAEFGREDAYYGIYFPGQAPIAYLDFGTVFAYASASRRINDQWEVGFYHSYSREIQDTVGGGGLVFPDYLQNDTAISVRHDVTDQWLVKFEMHYMDGAGKIFNTPTKPQPYDAADKSWVYLAAKTTYSF